MRYLIMLLLSIIFISTTAQYAVSKEDNFEERGKRLYRECSFCHGTTNSHLAGMNEEKFIHFAKNYRTILNPNPILLDVHQGLYSLSNNQIKILAKYIHNL